MNPEIPTLTRSQLRCLCDDQAASPKSRLDAAGMLLDHFGATARNLRIVKRVARTFEKYVTASTRTQTQVRWWSERLKARLERISEAETAQPEDSEENENDSALSEEESSTPTRKPIIANLDLLPVDGDNEYWDELIGGQSRRELFLMSLSLDPNLSRAEIVDAISNDPTKIAAHTLTVQLWALSRDQADAKYEADLALVRADLTERGLEDTDAGRDELVRQILATGEPLLQFEKASPANDFNNSGLPVLVRTAAGQLIDAVSFTESWPRLRTTHRPL